MLRMNIIQYCKYEQISSVDVKVEALVTISNIISDTGICYYQIIIIKAAKILYVFLL